MVDAVHFLFFCFFCGLFVASYERWLVFVATTLNTCYFVLSFFIVEDVMQILSWLWWTQLVGHWEFSYIEVAFAMEKEVPLHFGL